jgi:hypothetical protein
LGSFFLIGERGVADRAPLAFVEQEGSTLRGSYQCAIGNMVCRDANKTTSGDIVEGQVSGRMLTFRVILPADVSSCIYSGEASSTRAGGTYRCYQGGGLDEMGIWQVSRQLE